jgi:RNA polymerase sigma-70 factor (ECF subfamily)
MSAVVMQRSKEHTARSRRLAGSAEPTEQPAILSTRDLEVFASEYGDRLLAVARRLLRSAEDAADAVQDAFVSALAARRSFQGDSTVYTWLYRIVVNVCLMKLRSRPRAKCMPLERLLQASDDGGGCHQRPFSRRGERAEADLEREELRVAVRACIDKLPDDFRTILMLRDIEQLDTDRTAELLGLSRAAVKTRLHRARQALRTLLEPELAEL